MSDVVRKNGTFKTAEDAQHYAASMQLGGAKVDRRKLRPRAFDEFCEYLPDSTRTRRRAVCKICAKLHGHIRGVTESTFTLEWVVSEEHQDEVKERENNEASRHLRKKVTTDAGLKKVEDLHAMYKEDPDKYAEAAPLPPHEPIMTSREDAIELELEIEDAEIVARQVYNLAWCSALAVIAMQEPYVPAPQIAHGFDFSRVRVKEHAITVLAKHGVELPYDEDGKWKLASVEKFLCTLPRDQPVDLALTILQNHYVSGVRKLSKNKDYVKRVINYFKRARAAYMAVMKHVRDAFVGARVEEPWEQTDRVTRTLAGDETDEENDMEVSGQ